MNDGPHLLPRHREILEELFREHLPGVEVWAYGSRVTGESHDGSDLDLVLRGPELKEVDIGRLGDFTEAVEVSTIPFIVEARDWARIPKYFHDAILENYVVLSPRDRPNSTVMTSDRTEITLGDVCTKIGSGATPRGGKGTYLSRGPYALIRSQNVHNAGFSHDGLAFIGQEQADALQNVEVRHYDVLLNITGDSVARVCQVDPLVLPARVNQHVAIVRPDPSILDPEYLRYFLTSAEGQSTLLRWASAGGTRNALTKRMIESFVVQAPADLSEQRAVARILGALDDKIEFNRRMSQTLEEMARALFRSWFVDFDPVRAKAEERPSGLPPDLDALFPDSFELSELEDIPSNWQVAKFGEIVAQLRDNENPLDAPDTPFDHYSIPAYDMAQTPKKELGSNIKSIKTRVAPDTVLLSRLNPEIERVWLADVSRSDRAICSTEFMVLSPREPFTPSYAYCLTRSSGFRQQLASLVTGTSKSHQRAKPDAVLALPVIVPPTPLLQTFDRQVSPLLTETLCCRRETITLSHLRDTLLPKLLSGELRVRGAEQAPASTPA